MPPLLLQATLLRVPFRITFPRASFIILPFFALLALVLTNASRPSIDVPSIAPAAWSNMQQQVQNYSYRAVWQTTNDGTQAYYAPNQANGYLSAFTLDGVHISEQALTPSWELTLRPVAYGVGQTMQTLPQQAAELTADGQILTYTWNGQLTEWYINSADGLEQGFTLLERPSLADHALQLDLALDTLLEPIMTADGQAISLLNASGTEQLRYDKLHVIDANGMAISAEMSLHTTDSNSYLIRFTIDEQDAVYPLTIDPLLTNQLPVSANPVTWTPNNTLTDLNGAAGDQFGNAVAIDGDIIVIGAHHNAIGNQFNQGSAHVFGRNQGGDNNWGLVKTLTIGSGASDDQFGAAVAVSGDTIAVGAYLDDRGSNFDQGSVYLFDRNQGGTNNWGLVKTLTDSAGESDDWFGNALAINGDTLLVGAADDTVGSNPDQGSVHIFRRNQGGTNSWGKVKMLTDAGGAAFDLFGSAIALDGDIAIIGAEGDSNSQGSAHLFGRHTGGDNNWGFITTLADPNGGANDAFGAAVALDANTIVIGASRDTVSGQYGQGSAHIFSRNEGGSNNWGYVATRTDPSGAANEWFGSAVAIDNDTIVIGSSRDRIENSFAQGSAHVFGRNQNGNNTWGYVATLTDSNGASGDYFGSAIAISNDTLIIGAYAANVGDNFDQGNAILFNRSGGDWLQLLQVDDPDGNANDQFGSAVALDGEILAVGAPQADIGANGDQGAVYIFSRNHTGDNAWGMLTTITDASGASGDLFGSTLTLDGDMLVIGAPLDDVGSNSDQGSVHLFARNQGGDNQWGHVATLTAPDGASFDEFGSALALDSDTLAVGVYKDNVGSNADQGSVYLFGRNQGGNDSWGHITTLTAPDGTFSDQFGRSVAVSGDNVVVGAFWDMVGVQFAQGSAHVFGRNQGGANQWGHVSMLTAPEGVSGDRFGRAVAINENTIAVGAYADTVGDNSNQGSVHLFGNGDWSFITSLTDADGAASDFFGATLALDGNILLVGAARDNIVRQAATVSSAHLYGRNEGGSDQWGLITKLANAYSNVDQQFGAALALDGDTLAVGTNLNDAGAHLFGLRDKPSLGVSDISVNEGAGTATITILQSNVSIETKVNYATSNESARSGKDYAQSSGTLTIPAGSVQATFTVPIHEDAVDEINEQFTVALNTPINATIAITTAKVTIQDNDAQPTMSISDASLNEDGGVAILEVTLSHQSELPITADFSTYDSRAIGGQDYRSVSGQLNFSPLATARTIQVDIIEDVQFEPEGEQFTVWLANPVNATFTDRESVITIHDNDLGVFLPIVVR